MAGNQVGFSFQADVPHGASLLYNGSYRLLKLLSDGGLDALAVYASIRLGSQVPVTAAQELSVSRLVSSRGGRAGFLTKALRIGWGHSDVAIELARTQAGTGALLLIGAFTSGGSLFDAALGLRELLLMNGCLPEVCPNVDVLLTMVKFLAPFMHDSGFRSILQQIENAISKKWSSLGSFNHTFVSNGAGEPSEWAKAIKQLAFTATRREGIYLIVEQRAAWLAAVAVKIFGMAIEVRLGANLVWQAAGEQGSAIIQLSKAATVPLNPGIQILYLPPPSKESGKIPLTVDYAMRTALPDILKRDSRISKTICTAVYCAIMKCSRVMIPRCPIKWSHSSHIKIVLNGVWIGQMNRLFQVCLDLGIPERLVDSFATAEARSETSSKEVVDETDKQHPGLEFMLSTEASEITTLCGCLLIPCPTTAKDTFHKSYQSKTDCLCKSIGRLILGCASTILALLPCHYNPEELRIKGPTLYGDEETSWSKTTQAALTSDNVILALTNTMLLDHLSHLFHDDESVTHRHWKWMEEDSNLLAISAGAISIYHKMILDQECFTLDGEIIEVAHGRLSFEGASRQFVEEVIPSNNSRLKWDNRFGNNTPEALRSRFSRIAPGVGIFPHYAEGNVAATLQVSLSESAIQVSCLVRTSSHNPNEMKETFAINLCQCLERLMSCRATPREICGHNRDCPVIADDNLGTYAIATFCGYQNPSGPSDEQETVIFYALKGHGLEQIIQTSFLLPGRTVLQAGSCLSCAVHSATKMWPWNHVLKNDEAGRPKYRGSTNIIMTS